MKLREQKEKFRGRLAALPPVRHKGRRGAAVTKILPVLLVLLMGLHIVKPLGLPGLKKRGDFWKIAVIAILVMALAVGFHLREA